jgi:hypothetical protein
MTSTMATRLESFRDLAFRAGVARLRVRAATEAKQDVDEEESPADEQHGHQPVHENDHFVDVAGVRRGLGRQSQQIPH